MLEILKLLREREEKKADSDAEKRDRPGQHPEMEQNGFLFQHALHGRGMLSAESETVDGVEVQQADDQGGGTEELVRLLVAALADRESGDYNDYYAYDGEYGSEGMPEAATVVPPVSERGGRGFNGLLGGLFGDVEDINDVMSRMQTPRSPSGSQEGEDYDEAYYYYEQDENEGVAEAADAVSPSVARREGDVNDILGDLFGDVEDFDGVMGRAQAPRTQRSGNQAAPAPGGGGYVSSIIRSSGNGGFDIIIPDLNNFFSLDAGTSPGNSQPQAYAAQGGLNFQGLFPAPGNGVAAARQQQQQLPIYGGMLGF
jgi:hypothetical protein